MSGVNLIAYNSFFKPVNLLYNVKQRILHAVYLLYNVKQRILHAVYLLYNVKQRILHAVYLNIRNHPTRKLNC